MDWMYHAFVTLVFGATALLCGGLWLLWRAARGGGAARIARRLRSHGGGAAEAPVSITKTRLLSRSPPLQRLLQALPGTAAADRLLLQSGLSWSVARLAGLSLLALLLGLALASAANLPWPLRPAGAAAAALPLLGVLRAKARRLRRIELQLPEALDLMGRAMRAGHAFPTALKMAGDELPEPLAGEFRGVFDEVNFGVALADALLNLAARVPSTDLRYFVVAVLIQRETGGNLAELLTSISGIVRDRLKLLGQIRVLSAEGRMSAWVLSLLPFGAALLMQLSNPDFLGLLYTDPGGRKMLGVAALMMLIGIATIRAVTRIRV
ncbi:type II secretion system F family protein [Janthinobacterium fluminis]|uniref:Type II secretion system F family protein n=1 Tax=Janthinobacterium fluminis TaxID=2987524 RepID=A0ABT5K0T5_9BURK|nr:type II secretion system F family protein [Janthinobacterium fluminis]MDC8758023.1 type II secretion system F family protein [Janthinobacterium fluminis]